MFNWIKKLFKKEQCVQALVVEVEIKTRTRYNVRDKKGRFVKKGK